MKKSKIIVSVLVICLLASFLTSTLALTPATPYIDFGNLDDATYLVGEEPEALSIGLIIIGTTCQWQVKSTSSLPLYFDISGATGTSYMPPTSSAGTRIYRCVTTNGSTVNYSDSATITVLEKPTIAVTPASQTVITGGQATFTATASGTSGWQLTHSYWAWGPTANPADIAGDYSSEGDFAGTTFNKTLNTAGPVYWFYVGEYTDTANGTKNITVSSNGAQAVVQNKPTIVVTPASQSVAVGGQATFTATASGTSGWTLTRSYWAWGPTANTADIVGDNSLSGTFAATTFSKTLTTLGSQYWFYVGEYKDTTNATVNISVFSNGAQAVVYNTNPFTDIFPSDWFYNDVIYAYNLDLIDGMTPTTYVPNGKLTIAQAIKLAACMHQYYNYGAVTLVNGAVKWYDTYVDYAISKSIISSSTYAGRYDSNATRADYVKIFYYALPPAEYVETHSVPAGAIPDVSVTSPYGYEVYSFYRAGILQGKGMGMFGPGDPILRSEVAAIISRMMEPANRITAPYTWLP